MLPLLLAASATAFVLPEQVQLDDVHAGVGGERVVDLYIRLLTKYGEPVEDLSVIDIKLRDSARKVRPDELTLEALGDTTRGMTGVLVIDASPTMEGEAFDNAKAAARAFLERLGTYDKVAVVGFSGSPQVVADFDDPRAEARIKLDDLESDPNPSPTVLYDAVDTAISLIRKGQNLPRRTFVIVFSDGKDGGSSHTLDQVIESARGTETRAHILLFTLGYDRFGGEGLPTLQQMARETGGEYLQAGSVRNLKSYYTAIWRQLTRSYVIRFDAPMDGKMHQLTVEVGDKLGTKQAKYPYMRMPWWMWAAPTALLVAIALVAFLVVRGRSPGKLVFVDGPLAGETLTLRAGSTRIGSLPENDLVIDDTSVSRNHAEIHARGKRVEIQDLHSTNGTLVNGSAVKASPLEVGDKLQIGRVVAVFER